MDNTTINVLVLNCFSRNALAVIQNLNPEYRVLGGASKKDKHRAWVDRCFSDRRLHCILRYANPSDDLAQFEKDLIRLCNEHQIALIIPTGTTTSNALSTVKATIEANTQAKVAIEDHDKLDQVTDKWKSFCLADKLGLHVPKTLLLSPLETLEHVREVIGIPCVIKPRTSYASKGVQLVDDEATLARLLTSLKTETLADGTPMYLIQEKIAGQLHDVTSCSFQGEAFAMLTQRRVVSLYDWGGGGIVNLTTRDASSANQARQLIKYLSWNGILQFDFIRDSHGEFYLIECNPKFWGTTQLTISAGLNVAQYAVEVFLHHHVPENVPVYEEGLLFRWIFPEVIYHWIHRPFTFKRLRTRLRQTLSNHGAKRSLTNLTVRNIPHLIGIALEKGAG